MFPGLLSLKHKKTKCVELFRAFALQWQIKIWKNFCKKVLTIGRECGKILLALNRRHSDARVVELVDSLASGASARKGVRVRLPPRAPRRSKLHIACSDFFQKSERAHCAAPPFQIEPASLGFDLVLGAVSKENRFYPLIIQRDIRKDVPFALSIVAKTVFFFGCNLIFHGKKFLADSTLASPA